MRWLVFALALAAQPALASSWSCDGALSTEDRTFGKSDTKFSLFLGPTGKFRATDDESEGPLRSWYWSGHWTEIEGQVAMIGKARSTFDGPILTSPGHTEEELRAFSSIVQDDILLFTLKRRADRDTLVRCLREEF
ncbi:MAG: hypothetical protein AB3N22_05400 [Ruegeria sp.]